MANHQQRNRPTTAQRRRKFPTAYRETAFLAESNPTQDSSPFALSMQRDFSEPHNRATSVMLGPTLPGPRPQPIADGQSQKFPSRRTQAFLLLGGKDVPPSGKFPRSAHDSYPFSRAQAVAWASSSLRRCMVRHCSATGRTSTVKPYSSAGHSLAISSASLKSSNSRRK